MKLCAVTVWYNPENLQKNINAIDNIKSYSDFVEKVFVIDNSSKDNSNLLKGSDIRNLVYIPNNKNLGIARALNIGLSKGYEQGFDYVLTMDQDSFWIGTELEKFLKRIQELLISNNEICSFGPNVKEDGNISIYSELKTKIRKLLNVYKPAIVKERPDEEFINQVYTSGNVVSLSDWKKVGGFRDELFIDEVDHEFCYRLLDSGKKIIRLNNIKLNHCLGEKKRTFFGRVLNYTGIRVYYIVRNSLAVRRRYPEYTPYKIKDLKRFFIDSCVLNIKGLYNLKFFLKGIMDSKNVIISEKVI